MDVAIPTAMPCEPLANKLGKAEGKTTGSFPSSSYVTRKSTVSWSISNSINSAAIVILASVYLIAAALSPSMLPKLPWPSTNGYRKAKL